MAGTCDQSVDLQTKDGGMVSEKYIEMMISLSIHTQTRLDNTIPQYSAIDTEMDAVDAG